MLSYATLCTGNLGPGLLGMNVHLPQIIVASCPTICMHGLGCMVPATFACMLEMSISWS